MSSMTERKMRFLKDIVIFIWLSTLFAPLLAGPIEKDAAFTEKARPKTGAPVIPVAIPEEVNSLAVFGDELVYEEADPQFQNPRRDQVCESEASIGCKDRCITIDANCLCGTNGKTYRNVCEMACMRKVDMETINVRNVGKCEPLCSAERVMNYRKMLKELMTTKYLADHVRRCEKISNCNQAKVVVQFATKSGSQSIMECPENLPAFFLFTGLDCADYVDTTLQSVFNNETVVNCKSAGKVRNRLFNKKNCGWSNHGPTEKELVTWSFDILDENYDRQLVEKELNMLTNIPDQQCGESFFMDCDTDMDGFIREDEWSVCLGCPDCYRPCLVYQSKTMTDSKTRRYVQPIVTCEADGSCASKQCEKLWALHEVCWCVDRQCNEIEDTRSYAAMDCSARR
ncbi:testican-2-like isoform X5 [Bolinopsis microptera]|uniref:testican-2-like isoform X5 n=1 Tax=Bolinopsis microptera TaxID=2820187 RepID=UPI00307971D3